MRKTQDRKSHTAGSLELSGETVMKNFFLKSKLMLQTGIIEGISNILQKYFGEI